MSMPCTCPHRDWLMYILYSCDSEFMSQVIATAVSGIDAEHSTRGVTEALEPFRPSPGDCLHALRIKLLVLLDQDEGTRRRLCEFSSPTVRNYAPVPPEKADRFYAELHDRLIPDWIKDETVSAGEFVDRARMAYLIS
jgi:hypothetical protein